MKLLGKLCFFSFPYTLNAWLWWFMTVNILRKTSQLSKMSLVSRSIVAGCQLTECWMGQSGQNTPAGSDISGDVMLATKNGYQVEKHCMDEWVRPGGNVVALGRFEALWTMTHRRKAVLTGRPLASHSIWVPTRGHSWDDTSTYCKILH